MNYIKAYWKKVVASILVVTMLCTSISLEAFAIDNTSVTQEKQQEKEKTRENIEGEYQIRKEDVIEAQSTADTTTYDAGNGLLVTEYYAQPVRYEDESGNLVDYDPSLVKIGKDERKKGKKLEGYLYKNNKGDKKHYFPENLTEKTPILMENDEYQIKFVPIEMALPEEVSNISVGDEVRAVFNLEDEYLETDVDEISTDVERFSDDEVSQPPEDVTVIETEDVELQEDTIVDIYEEESVQDIKTSYLGIDGKTTYQYTSLEQGVKEEIILEEKPDVNQFAFLLEIPGLSIRENALDEGITIYDNDDIVAGIQAPYMNDATGEAYSEELTYSLETVDEEKGIYKIILTVDEKYLNSEERVYPITIDPTVTWDTNSEMSEVYILSEYPSTNFYDSGIVAFYLGYGSQGKSRAYFKFNKISNVKGKYIKSAKMTLKECSNSQSGKKIYAHRIITSWDKTTIKWNKRPTYKNASFASFTSKGPGGTPSMDFTELIRGYANGDYANHGIVLMNANETSNTGFTKFYGMRHSTASYRPKLKIEYYTKPTTATSVTVEPQYIQSGQSTTLSWAGITSTELSYIHYRLAEYDAKTKEEGIIIEPYSPDTKIGTTASGSKLLTIGSDVAEDDYQAYKINVRGVGKSGAAGIGKITYLYVDNAKPTGSIKVLAAGSAEETSILQDTVQIIGNVDGTGSPVETSSMKLYDANDNFIEDIYVDATDSKSDAKFTAEVPNGEYILKLYIKDKAGNEDTIEKNVTVLNRISAPVLQTTYTNQKTAVVNWEIPNNGTKVKEIAYKLSGSTEWNKTTDVVGNKGSFTITLPEEEGSYVVNVCGIDEIGTYGAEASVTCVVDKTIPEVQIHETDRGIIFATVKDKNLESWTLSLKLEGSEVEEKLHFGKNNLENEYLGFFDRSKMEVGKNYKLILKGTDRAGNVNQVLVEEIRTADETVAEAIAPSFRVKRPMYTGDSQSHIVYPTDISRLELKAVALSENVLDGNTRWYCDGELVSSEPAWSQNLPTEEGKSHTILALIEKDGEVSYSQTYIKNRLLIPVITGLNMELPENCVSFRLNTGGETGTATVVLDNGTESIIVESGVTYHISQITNGEKSTAANILISASTEGDTVDWVIEADSVLEETFELSSIENYHPYELAVKDKLNYKTYLNWKGIDGEWPENISYEIYRAQENGFTPSEENLIARDIKANYWAEMNINYSRQFYYKIRAVEKDDTGTVVKASSFSNQVSSTVIAVDEYVKRLGIKEYWEYAEFETPSGNGYIEKSKGNLAYTQVDTEIPNEQLPVVLERTYNSQSTAKAAFGIGWTHSFDLELLNICKDNSLNFNNIVFKDGNGTLYFFNKNEEGEYISSMGKYITLKKEDKKEEVALPDNETIGVENKEKKIEVVSTFTMTTKDNVEYRFNSSGQLIYMAEANGNFLVFEYEPNKGLLSKVTTSKNLTMEFLYFTEEDAEKRTIEPDFLTVKEIHLPDGSKMLYEYTNSRLSEVTKVGTDGTSTISWSLEYNDDKQLITLSDACGNKYQIGYAEEKATKVTYPNGEAIALKYNEDGSTSTYKEVTEDGHAEQILLETNIFHSSSGNSLSMTDSYGNEVTYKYEDNLRSEEKYSMTYYEIEDGRMVEKQTTKCDTTKYDDNENVVSETDEDGITETYTYVGGNSKIAHLPEEYKETNEEEILITHEKYSYDDNGNLKKREDLLSGLVVETEYYDKDEPNIGALKGEIKSEIEYYVNDRDNNTYSETEYTYDSNGKKTEIITEKSGDYTVETTNIYDVMGRLISSTDTLGVTTTTEYDPFGRVSKVTVKQGKIVDVVTRKYDANGTLLEEVAEDGTVYAYTYDNMNRVVSESVKNGETKDTWTTEYSNGSVEINTGKGKEVVEDVFITTEKNPEGKVLAITYTDTLGRTIRQMQSGLYVDYTYDREDHVITTCQLGTNPDNPDPIVTVNLYDEKGCLSGQVLKPEYDPLTDQFVVTEDSISQTAVYDSTGNMTSVTDALGNTTSYTYDAYGRIKTVTLPNEEGVEANITSYQYDQFDDKKKGHTKNTVTDAMGRTSVTTYNSAMQVVSVSDKGDGSEDAIEQTYTYDSEGRTSVITDSIGNTTNYTYDAKDRVTKVVYKNAEKETVLRTEYTYDKSDNVTSMLDYEVSNGIAVQYHYTGFTYDHHKRLTSLVEMNTSKSPSALTTEELAQHTTSYTYDKDGNLLTVTYPKSDWNVKSLEYVYDDANKWLMEIKASVQEDISANVEKVTLREYSYDTYGDVAEIKDYRVLSENGTVVENPEYTTCSYEYDAYRRPILMEYADSVAPDIVKESYTYVYDKNSRLVEETLLNLYPSETGEQQNEKRCYTYDVYGNLVKTEIEDFTDSSLSHTLSYTYDAVGNRLTQTKTVGETAETTAYTYNSLNQMLTSVTTAADGSITENKTYTYDKNGNQIKVTDSVGDIVTTSTYDPIGQLSKYVKEKDGSVTLTQTNKYNGSGARIQKTENGESINYFYSQGGVLYTTDEDGNDTALNLMGVSGNIISTARNEDNTESYYYYHKDPAGSITNLRNASGTSVVSYQYTDFGETSIYGDTDFYNEICYNESIYDKSTGLYYLNARYYNPEDGRFLTRDSYRGDAARPSTLHLYAYCANNPINYEDPSGHIAISRIVGGVIGALAGGFVGSKIAKKTGAKGWKKVAIVAGCALAGGVVGAIAGPKVAKVAKKAAKYVSKKLPSKKQIYSAAKNKVKKAQSSVKKTVSKAKKAISKAKKQGNSTSNLDEVLGHSGGSNQGGSGGKKFSKEFEQWLNKGKADNKVYHGIKNGKYEYTGITKQTKKARLYQHNRNGKGFEDLDIIYKNLTRNQARSIEQFYIENGPNALNQINSISPKNKFYSEALEWAAEYIKLHPH